MLPLDVFVEPGGAYVTTYSNTAGGELFVAALDGSKKASLAATPGVLYGVVRTKVRANVLALTYRFGVKGSCRIEDEPSTVMAFTLPP